MPDPFLFIVAIIAIVTIVLFPIRLWQRRRRRYGTDESGGADVPLTPDD